MMNIINLSCSLPSPSGNPWSLIGQSYTDLTFLIGGEGHHYHQAIVAQHSSMVRDILTKARCCRCLGAECMHHAREIIITLDNVKVEVFKVVMEIVYDGCGKVPDEVEEFKSIVNMLNLDSLFIRDKRDRNGNKDTEDHIEIDQDAKNHDEDGDASHNVLDARYENSFFTNDIGEIDELRLSNMMSDTIDTFEDDNFSVTVQEIQIDNPEDKIDSEMLDRNVSLIQNEKDIINNIICDTKMGEMDEEEADIYEYDYEDGDEVASSGSDEHTSEDSDDETNADSETNSTHSDFVDKNRIADDISDDDDIIEIEPTEQKEQNSFNIRNHILTRKYQAEEPKMEVKEKVALNAHGIKRSSQQLLKEHNINQASSTVNKSEDDDKILMEDNQESNIEDTLSEFTSLLRRKNTEVKNDLDNSKKNLVGMSQIRPEVPKKESGGIIVYHCPFENCSYSNKRSVDFHTHIGARHYRTKIQELYPNFIHKYCDKCEKTFSVTGNYYTHMSKHQNLPFMSKADIASLGRVENMEQVKQAKMKDEDVSNDSSYGSHLLETFTAKCLKENIESEKQFEPPTFTDDDDIIEISPPKRKSPPTGANCKRTKRVSL